MAHRLSVHASSGVPSTRKPTQCEPRPSNPVAHLGTKARHCAAALVVAGGLLYGPALAPGPALAALDGRSPRLELALRLPLANTNPVVAAVEEVEEVAAKAFHFLEQGAELVGHEVHHLQVFHALEHLEGMPLNKVVDLDLLKVAMHPPGAAFASERGAEDEAEGAGGAVRQLDAALDAVADWRLRDVVDIGKLAVALEDVHFSGPLEARSLQRAAPRIRRAVHWEAVVEAVRPQPLREALEALGGGGAGPFAQLDVRAAMGAVRSEAVMGVLAPERGRASSRNHTLEASGMWTWES